ncbi:MAG: PH domain-containing protein [Terrimesophilobacter sp.]
MSDTPGEPPIEPPIAPPIATPPASPGGRLADGEWHRMHPATPLLKGGVTLIVIFGVIFANLRERIFDLFIPHYYSGDPLDYVLDNGFIGWLLLAILVLIIVLIALFSVSWLLHSFRITNEVVEVRSGVLFRTNRKARLDRIQGINIVRPVFARLFGAAKLEINQAGQDANVQLTYLASAAADDLRREILRLASGTHQAAAPTQAARAGETVVERRVNEFLAPELDPNAVPAESIVKLHLGRLIGSLVLSTTTIIAIVATVVTVVVAANIKEPVIVFIVLPMFLGFGGFYVSRFSKSLRYSIAGTPDGIRVGFGLLSTSNETLPPGRIHSIQVSQPLLWRGPDWWEIKVNRASHSSTKGAAGEANTTILPVGSRSDVRKVLELMLPELSAATVLPGATELPEDTELPEATAHDDSDAKAVWAVLDAGLYSKGRAGDGFTNSPRRAALLRWFSWRRNGFAITLGSLLLRKGAIWRQLIIVPQPRLQSVTVQQGPLLRMLGLAHVHLDTVSGPISADLGAIDRDAAVQFFEDVARAAVSADQTDTTHRWRAADQPV